MNIYISGGCKTGKSTFAQKIALSISDNGALYYIATMIAVDDEDRQRIISHQHKREGQGFETVECGMDIGKLMYSCNQKGTFLLDSATALLANEMFHFSGTTNQNAPVKVADELSAMLLSVKNAVIVSDYIYSDAQIYGKLTEKYRRGLSYIDRRCAALCDVVIETCFNCKIFHKGKGLLGELL